ncbi:hypothetical protein ACX3PU_05900 [Chryseobacterium sp. A301]
MKIISFLRTNAMLVVALLTAGITMSFQMAEKSQNAEDVVYHYIGTDMTDDFSDLSNWSTVNNQVNCSTTELALPCKITLPETTPLSSVLYGKNNAAVKAISEGFKPES